jgi:SAM-dependent methyltransferase
MGPEGTQNEGYTRRLEKLQGARWKRLLKVQAPYRWNLRRLRPGFTLDLGCGTGRNLVHLDGNGVGIDHNPHSVDIARSAGLRAFTPEQFRSSEYAKPGAFFSILLSHVVEHMTMGEAVELIREYLQFLNEQGRLIFITPQEKGFKSDPTHVEFASFSEIGEMCSELGFRPVREHSFPFPRPLGRVFTYNEFVVVASRDPA